jgi:hypothetical protein
MDLALFVPIADVGKDLGLGEGPDALLDEAVLVGEGEVDHGRRVPLTVLDGAVIVPRPPRGPSPVGAAHILG